METLDIHAIRATLPHRYPMLLVDRVLELEPGVRIKALKNVTINEPYFPGHFPHYPVMPGVLIVEALAQASAIIAYRGDPEAREGRKLFMFAGIDDARFKRQVVPGDTLILESTFVKGMRDVGKYAVRATVDGQVACEATLLSVLRPMPTAG
ncbi:MAG TPA: 3-hydroxyacyl-ACP dehydratase FabZ [Casimicrobiaceae bacterium]|jgi:3-hydroxyacyl-[acyl-carrier-protein] dehydratase|nr:3-hydroxyacyl-ACP dehydratase FabZ [Casimicrobiaceae bacterium]